MSISDFWLCRMYCEVPVQGISFWDVAQCASRRLTNQPRSSDVLSMTVVTCEYKYSRGPYEGMMMLIDDDDVWSTHLGMHLFLCLVFA
mmetsp:Transcript_131919/g.214808  ORF Transcript_131919/g.214808 Transcript_131919/m.214808 type:complete len:88 (+) Transcript_131919:1709-1972(+)